jgi:acyl dehydratase
MGMVTGDTAFAEYVDLAVVGEWTEEFPYRVEDQHIRAYAAATNDIVDRRHANGEIAPPMFAVVANRQAVVRVLALAMPRGNPPGIQRLLGEQDIFFQCPILPKTVVWSKAALIGVHVKRSGTILVFRTITRDGQGVRLNGQYMTSFVPRLIVGRSTGLEAPTFRLPEDLTSAEPVDRVTLRTDPDQTYRYAPASGDLSRFHLDEEYARSVGAPGIMLHGLCTMAFIGRAITESRCGGDATHLKRLALRFTHPVFPGEEISTTVWAGGERDGRCVYSFEAMSSSGQAVARHGRAEVDP